MLRLFVAPLTVFVEFKLVSIGLFVFTGPIIDTFALGAGQFDESIL